MSRKTGNTSGPRTDHSHESDSMRAYAKLLTNGDPFSPVTTVAGPMPAGALVTIMDAAAALLEVHDATGISLDSWRGPRELVEYALTLMQFPANTLLDNRV
jgi:hypothetical protein